ncbi:MAG: response regulator transcription factor [Acidobacteria bacterium]|nr:response regulator transcription factor [Acidobacteriota bacterium]
MKRDHIRILAVDDDPEALRYLRDTLLKAGYEPILTGDPREAMGLLRERPQLVLLDLMLPGIDGIDLMGEILKSHDLPVLFLSAYGLEEVVGRALDAGAADYIVKPFAPTELTARIRAALRRHGPPEPAQNYVAGDLTIEYAERHVTLGGLPVHLTPLEYRTLAELSMRAGRVVTYASLLRRAWGIDEGSDVRPIRTVISTLRRRLGDSATNPRYIFTEPRLGYRMALPSAGGSAPEEPDG